METDYVYDKNLLLDVDERKLASKLVKNGGVNDALYFKRESHTVAGNYTVYCGVACFLDYDETAYFTRPLPYFFIVNTKTNQLVGITDAKDYRENELIISLINKPLNMKQSIYGKDMKYKNAIFNLETGNIIPIDEHLEYDEKGNICVKEKIVTIKKTIYKNGKLQQPVYENSNDLTI